MVITIALLIICHGLISRSKNPCNLVGSSANNAASSLDLHLASITQQFLSEALSLSTRKAYLRTWNMILELCRSTSTSFIFPCSLLIIYNFISHLHSQSLSLSTILSHVSTIKYVHKICHRYTQQF